jgi:arabinogalactan oligomer/maltooligosaccharide transport system permease protein
VLSVIGSLINVPKAFDESALIDDATKFQIFYKIILPLSKLMIVYKVLTSFMSPWME